MAAAENLSQFFTQRIPGRKSTPNLQIVRPQEIARPLIQIERSEPIIASDSESFAAFNNDPLLEPGLRSNYNYINLAKYKFLEGGELDLVQRLNTTTFEMLRGMGLLLFNPLTSRYFLMVEFAGEPILDLINLIEEDINNISRGINRAVSENGLKNGVLNGSIKDINSYLRANQFIKGDSHLIAVAKSIFNFNIELAANYIEPDIEQLLANQAKTPEPKVENQDKEKLKERALVILESDESLSELAQIMSANPEMGEMLLEIVPQIGREPRSKLLNFLESIGIFTWTDTQIDTSDKLSALVPIETPQFSTRKLIQKHILSPVNNFLTLNPIWIKCYGEVVNYVVERLRDIGSTLGNALSEEDLQKIKVYLLNEVGNNFKFELRKGATPVEG